jgi:SprT protein
MKPFFSYFLTEPEPKMLDIVSPDIKELINIRLQKCIVDAEEHFNMKFDFPTINYSLLGTTAGRANYFYWSVNFNPILLTENVEEYIRSTVPHEMAHLIHDKLTRWKNFKRIFGSKHNPHNDMWEEIMLMLGAKPRIQHHYNVSSTYNQ